MTPASAAVVANSRIKVLAFIYAWVFGSLVLGRLLLLVSEQRPKNHFWLIGTGCFFPRGMMNSIRSQVSSLVIGGSSQPPLRRKP